MKSTQDTYGFKKFKEVTMNDPIRYAINDEI